jgi:hypothetical protein
MLDMTDLGPGCLLYDCHFETAFLPLLIIYTEVVTHRRLLLEDACSKKAQRKKGYIDMNRYSK